MLEAGLGEGVVDQVGYLFEVVGEIGASHCGFVEYMGSFCLLLFEFAFLLGL